MEDAAVQRTDYTKAMETRSDWRKVGAEMKLGTVSSERHRQSEREEPRNKWKVRGQLAEEEKTQRDKKSRKKKRGGERRRDLP